MGDSKQGGKVINIDHSFISNVINVGNGALRPPAESKKRKKSRKDRKLSKLHGKAIPQLPNLPPSVENVKQSELLNVLRGLMHGLELLLKQKTSELGGGPETTTTATPVLEDVEEFLEEFQPSVDTWQAETDETEEPEEPEEY
ncbi:unnamed protein product [Cylicocyclus nassatus]|uniref:Uncharacterized protein n=1 Tax=Cylicocyclus nassatus TaxID=53992 RepID=A0AA36HET5_CYLNA|nr:unnamed protein product [Cylicocyclus nassatus]